MMFPKPPKKEKKQKTKLVQRTPLKQTTPLKAKTSLKANKKLEAKTALKANTTLKQTTPLKAKTSLKANKKLEAKTNLKVKTQIKAYTSLENKKKSFKIAENKNAYKVKKIRVNKRAIFSDFAKEEKEYIVKRDECKCVYCGGTTYLGIAHIFASRQKGGVGNRKNGVVLCQLCHNALDNGKDTELRENIQKFCENYLTKIYGEIKLSEIIYDKNNNYDKNIS